MINALERKSPLELQESTASYLIALINHFCTRDDLSTFDPYDMWGTSLGFGIKKLYNRRPGLGAMPAALLSLFDDLINHKLRWFYKSTEYPIVRAMAALSLLHLHRATRERRLLEEAERHLQWLLANSCRGFSGYCWGLGVPSAISKKIIYDRDTPLSTITPYALEAFVAFVQATNDTRFSPAIESIFRFFENDIQVMEEDDDALATSYATWRDRTVVNAVSYTMYAYSMFLPFAAARHKQRIEAKVRKLYAYVRRIQRSDGAWWYSPHGRSFIDCFHSCIVIKNVVKTNSIVPLDGSEALVAAGYRYLKRALLDEDRFLFRRFSVNHVYSPIRFDLYDNAEALNLALLVDDWSFARDLLDSMIRTFCDDLDIYSQINSIGAHKNRNTLRWAVMPFLSAASQMIPTVDSWKLA